MRLRIDRNQMKRIEWHAIREFPYECCGLLIGEVEGEEAVVLETIETRNVHEGDRRVRYQVDPMMYYEAEKRAEEEGLEVIGVYHSHPLGRPEPSVIDLENAVPGFFYIIVSVRDGSIGGASAWRFPREGKGFQRVELMVD